jgi:hypothetical protein
MTFSINVKELPERCFYSPYSSKLNKCYPAYEYNLKTTKIFRFETELKKNDPYSIYPISIAKEIDSFEIENKYSKLIISKSLTGTCTLKINKDISTLYCNSPISSMYNYNDDSNTLLIKCDPSKILIVENNKGDSSASVDHDELTTLVELGFYKSVLLVCPDILGDDSTLLGDNHVHTAHNEL